MVTFWNVDSTSEPRSPASSGPSVTSPLLTCDVGSLELPRLQSLICISFTVVAPATPRAGACAPVGRRPIALAAELVTRVAVAPVSTTNRYGFPCTVTGAKARVWPLRLTTCSGTVAGVGAGDCVGFTGPTRWARVPAVTGAG